MSEICKSVARAKAFSGLSCQSMFGKESMMIEHCAEVCEETEGAKYTALCMSRMSLGRPRIAADEVRRCFGTDNPQVDQSNADWRLQEFGTDASGAGPKIEGKISMGGHVVEE